MPKSIGKSRLQRKSKSQSQTMSRLNVPGDPVDHLKSMRSHDPIPEPEGVYVAGPSGALSSSRKLRFDLIPRSMLEAVAARFELGTEKYPPFNYKQGLEDKAYIIERINHMFQHFNELLSPMTNDEWEDDHLGALGWGVAFLCEVMTTSGGRAIIAEIRDERARRTKAVFGK